MSKELVKALIVLGKSVFKYRQRASIVYSEATVRAMSSCMAQIFWVTRTHVEEFSSVGMACSLQRPSDEQH